MNIKIIRKLTSLLVFGFLMVFTNAQILNSHIQTADEGQFPYIISLSAEGTHLCDGSIISQNYVVTAANCIHADEVPLLEIRAGSTIMDSRSVVIKVAKVITHPEYNETDIVMNNDIALLKLSEPLHFNDRIKAIPLANETVPLGASVVVTGLSYTTKHLQYTDLRAISFVECDRILTDLPRSEICFAPINGNGLCSGDHGGPAVYNGRLVGVENENIGVCGSNDPVAFSSVLYNLKWLRENSDV